MEVRQRCFGQPVLWMVISALFACSVPAQADVLYVVSANTTAIRGVTGVFGLQFNPGGLGALPATATITNFSTDGTGLSLNMTDGDVAGPLLPGPLVLNNTQALNDLLENITFGTALTFTLALSGPGVASPDASLPGSSFALSLYDADFNSLLTTDPAGTVVTASLNPDDSPSVFTFPSDNAGGLPVGTASPPAIVNPEPGSFLLLATGLLGMGAYTWASRRRLNLE